MLPRLWNLVTVVHTESGKNGWKVDIRWLPLLSNRVPASLCQIPNLTGWIQFRHPFKALRQKSSYRPRSCGIWWHMCTWSFIKEKTIWHPCECQCWEKLDLSDTLVAINTRSCIEYYIGFLHVLDCIWIWHPISNLFLRSKNLMEIHKPLMCKSISSSLSIQCY